MNLGDLRQVQRFHTDRGSEFKNHKMDELLETFKIGRSLSMKGFGFLVPFLHAVQGFGELIFIKVGLIPNAYSEAIFKGIFLLGSVLFGMLLWQYCNITDPPVQRLP